MFNLLKIDEYIIHYSKTMIKKTTYFVLNLALSDLQQTLPRMAMWTVSDCPFPGRVFRKTLQTLVRVR